MNIKIKGNIIVFHHENKIEEFHVEDIKKVELTTSTRWGWEILSFIFGFILNEFSSGHGFEKFVIRLFLINDETVDLDVGNNMGTEEYDMLEKQVDNLNEVLITR